MVIDKLVRSRRNIKFYDWCKYGALRGPKCSRWVAPERIEGVEFVKREPVNTGVNISTEAIGEQYAIELVLCELPVPA